MATEVATLFFSPMVLQLEAVGRSSPGVVVSGAGWEMPGGKTIFGRAFGTLSGEHEGPKVGRTVACGPTVREGFA